MNVRGLWNWRVALTFSVVGPAVGALMLVLLLDDPALVSSLLTGSFSSLAVFLGASYVVGFPPALVTGLLASTLWAARCIRDRWWVRAATGAGLGYGVLLLLQLDGLGVSAEFGDPLVFSLLGAAGGFVSGLIAGGWVAPNDSLKRTDQSLRD
jgi:hypothetical protein